jgi:DNA-binding response OmpR family regulator
MSDPKPRFAYTAGPVQDHQQIEDLNELAESEDVPAVLNTYVPLSTNLLNKFKRIRDSFRRNHDPKHFGSLDQHILETDNRQSKDYRLALENHLRQVLSAYEKLNENIILVPGRFDLSVEEMRKFNDKHDLGIEEELFDEERFSFRISDGETVSLPGQDEDLLGIGGITGFNKDLPDIIQRADFFLLSETNWQEAADVVSTQTDYLVSAAGISGTYDHDLYDGGSFEVFNQQLSGDKLVLDPCPDRLDLHHLATITGGRPLVHGKVTSFDWAVHLLKDRPDHECKFSIHVHDRTDERLVIGYKPGEWVELESAEDEEEEEEEQQEPVEEPAPAGPEGNTDRLKDLIEEQDPNILVLVNNPDEFVDIIRMRLFDKLDHFHIFDSSGDALKEYREIDPSFVILEDQVEGADDFLRELKIQPGSRLVSVIKIYDKGEDPEHKPVDFKIWEDNHLVEPFELMELFAQIEAELVRFPDREESHVHQLRFSFRPSEEHIEQALGLGNELIRNLELNRGDHQGLQGTYKDLLTEAINSQEDLDENSSVNVTFHLSRKHLTLTVEVEEGDYIKSISEKLGALPQLTGS